MDLASRVRNCSKCARELVNANGVHMGIPFGHWTTHAKYSYSPMDPKSEPHKMLVCAGCYDEITVNLDTKIQRTGEETV